MTSAEMLAACDRFPSGYVLVVLVLRRRMPAHTDRVRLAGRSGPVGRAIGVVERGLLAEFRSSEVRAWLEKQEKSDG